MVTEIHELDDGSLEVNFLEVEKPVKFQEIEEESEHFKNLVEELEEGLLDEISLGVVNRAEADEQSRGDWMQTIERGLNLLGVKLEEKNKPFQGACSAQHPLLMESAVKFQSKASAELLPADGPVNVKVIGESTTEKEEQANRVKHHMNYQVTEEMTEYYIDTEKLLLYTSIMGSGFKKIYHDAHYERPVSEFVPADQLIVPNNVSDLQRADRYTHVLHKTKYQLEADFAAGLYEKPDNLGNPSQPIYNDVQIKASEIIGIDMGYSDDDQMYTLLEQHVDTYIPGIEDDEDDEFELASPYIITVDKTSRKVLGIRRNWEEEDLKRKKIMRFVHFGFVPSFGFYNYGFLHLLGNLQLSLTSSLRSLVDAGQFANLQGGFKLKGVRISDDNDPIFPGEFKEIEAGIMDIKKAIMPLPFHGADQTLYQMLEFLDRKGQKFADSTEQVIADSTNYGPVGTTLALLDASTKFFAAIHKRLHNSQKQELKLIAKINGETLPENLAYNEKNEKMAVTREDYDDTVDVVPVSDPNISSNAHRLTKAQAIYEMALKSPEVHDMREVLKHVYTNMDYPNIDKILPEPDQAQENDPITDINLAIEGKPIKAFEGQDHDSHISLKQAFVNDPMSGGSQFLSKARLGLSANITEHMFLKFKEQSQAQAQLTGVDQATAAEQIAQQNQQIMNQQHQEQDDKTDEAAMILAQAEMLQEQTNQEKLEFDKLYKAAELELKKEQLDLEKMKEISKIQQLDKKLANELEKIVTTKGLDAMVEALIQKAEPKKEQ